MNLKLFRPPFLCYNAKRGDAMSFARWKKIRIVLLCITVALLFTVPLMPDETLRGALTGLMYALIIGTGVVSANIWRCPSCGQRLPIRHQGAMEFCMFCGKPIDNE